MIKNESEIMTDLELIATLSFTRENGVLTAWFPNGDGYFEVVGDQLFCCEVCSDGSVVKTLKNLVG